VANILAAYRAADPGQLAAGHAWYQSAHDLAVMLADGSDARAVAGCIAALSARMPWERNVTLARRAVAGDLSGHTRDVLAKVARILAGELPETVLPMDLKTGMFYRCIANPGDADAVVVDRHAHDVAVGRRYGNNDRGLSSKARYAMLVHCYREAAMQLGVLPSQCQAVTWLVQITRNNGSET
jgi:hypothetical protein